MNRKFVKSWQTDVRNRIFEWVESAELIPSHGFILLRLMEYANYSTGRDAFPGLSRLARDTAMSESTVTRALQDGRDLLLIEETQHGGGAGPNRKASVFRFLSPVLKNQPRGHLHSEPLNTDANTPVTTAARTKVTTKSGSAGLPTRPTRPSRTTKTDSSISTSKTVKKKNVGSFHHSAEDSAKEGLGRKRTVKVKRKLVRQIYRDEGSHPDVDG